MIQISVKQGQIIPIEEAERIETERLALESAPTTDEVVADLLALLIAQGVITNV